MFQTCLEIKRSDHPVAPANHPRLQIIIDKMYVAPRSEKMINAFVFAVQMPNVFEVVRPIIVAFHNDTAENPVGGHHQDAVVVQQDTEVVQENAVGVPFHDHDQDQDHVHA